MNVVFCVSTPRGSRASAPRQITAAASGMSASRPDRRPAAFSRSPDRRRRSHAAPQGPDGGRDGGVQRGLLATRIIGTCVRSAAQNRFSLIAFGQASASTQICMAYPAERVEAALAGAEMIRRRSTVEWRGDWRSGRTPWIDDRSERRRGCAASALFRPPRACSRAPRLRVGARRGAGHPRPAGLVGGTDEPDARADCPLQSEAERHRPLDAGRGTRAGARG